MSDYADRYIRRNLRINRVAAGEAIKTAKKAASVQGRINAVLLGLSDSGFSQEGRNKAVRKISDLLSKQYSDSAKEAEKLATEIVRLEAEWQVSTFSEFTTSTVNTIPIEEAVQISRTTPYQGKTFQTWFKDAGVKSHRKAFGIIEAGFVSGRPASEISREVQSLSKKAIPEIKTLVRSNLLHAASIGREQVMQANDDLIEGKIWNSTLDIRTTADICGVRDQAEYDRDNQPVGHSLPWGAGPGQIHFNCRSIQIPKITGVPLSVGRPSVGSGKEYQRGDKTTNRGTVRKPTKANRDKGIFKIQQKSPGTDYESWLRTQKTDFVADALNSKEKAKAFKNGESLFSLTSSPLGAPLEINQL